MKENRIPRVVMSKKSYYQITDRVMNAGNDYEVGGILLGYKIFRSYYVVAVTVSVEIAEKSRVSFILDGEWHTARALELMQDFWLKPSILGVWHSHICDGATFSAQDRQSNRQLAMSFNGVLSMIVMLTMALKTLDMAAYYISANGDEQYCQVISDWQFVSPKKHKV